MSVGLVVATLLAGGMMSGCKRNQTAAPDAEPVMYDAPPPALPDASIGDAGLYQTGGTGTTAPAPVPVYEPATMPAGGGQTYVVQKGDTLMSIARKVYGNPGKFRDIAAANGISDPNKIKVGQTLTLP